MRLSRIAIAVLIGAVLVSEGLGQPQPSEAVKLTSRASNDFACDLFRAVTQGSGDENAFFSPWSISSALAMTMEGARYDTALEMGQVLRLPKDLRHGGERPWRLEPYHLGFADMQRRCATKSDGPKGAAFDLNIANALWGEKTYPFDPKFAEAIGGHYGTDVVQPVDFIKNFPAERIKINSWVEKQTKNKIKDIIPTMRPEEARLIRLILVNAIYFKGDWVTSFDKKHTQEEPFLRADGTKNNAKLMQATLSARYAAFQADGAYFETPHFRDGNAKLYPDGDSFQIAELPYKGGKLAMTVILPRNPKGLSAIEKNLSADKLGLWLSRLEARTVQVKLPKFRMETSYGLGEVLGKMGMKKAFDPDRADFSGMTTSRSEEHRLHISKVLHKAFVDVNEEGTEAAAATAVIMSKRKSKGATPFNPDFYADRPFLFMIREIDTGAILFMGRMATPGKL